MKTLRPADLAREHGISTQAVRNYERDGFIPAARRTPSGYRIYTALHEAALRAFLALVPAYGFSMAGQIMTAVGRGDLDAALALVDGGHGQLQRDRETLAAVRSAVDHLTAGGARTGPASRAASGVPSGAETRTIGELAHRIRVTPATLRTWERVGILVPARDPATGYRVYGASDVRDAELAHLLRRGGYLLAQIASVVRQIRTAGGTDRLASALADWQRKLTVQGRAMVTAAARLEAYLTIAATEAPR